MSKQTIYNILYISTILVGFFEIGRGKGKNIRFYIKIKSVFSTNYGITLTKNYRREARNQQTNMLFLTTQHEKNPEKHCRVSTILLTFAAELSDRRKQKKES